MRSIFRCLLSVVVVLCACGDNNNNNNNNYNQPDNSNDNRTYIRYFNGVANARSTDFVLNGSVYYSDVNYLNTTGYFRVDTNNQDVRVVESSTFTTLYDRQGTLNDDYDQSLFVFGTAATPRSLFLNDDNSKPGSDVAKLRVINLASAAQAVDVYVLTSSVSIASVAPTAAALGVGGVSDYFISDSGTYRVTVTKRGSKEPLAILADRSFGGNEVFTIVVGNTQPGNLPVRIVVLRDK